MLNNKQYGIQLRDAVTGKAIITAGGKVYVATADGAAKATLYDREGASLANPITPTRGYIEFWTGIAVESVDLYIMSPTGHFLVAKGVQASGPNEINVDTSQRYCSMVIPFAIADTTATTETATGFVIPAKAAVLPTPLLDVLTQDATETIDVGTDSGDSGDANGFLAAASVATAGIVKPTLASGGQTLGALLSADESGAGVLVPEPNISMVGKEVTYTLSAGSDTAAGFIHLPYLLAA